LPRSRPGVDPVSDGEVGYPAGSQLHARVGEQADWFRFLVRDRDTKFTASFGAVFADVGIEVLRSPPRAPKANAYAYAYAERWVSTIRRECLDRMLIFHERQLRHVLAEYATHYNSHRPHRALEQRSPTERGAIQLRCASGVVRRTQILGDLINEYHHAA
jgi:putative transposase